MLKVFQDWFSGSADQTDNHIPLKFLFLILTSLMGHGWYLIVQLFNCRLTRWSQLLEFGLMCNTVTGKLIITTQIPLDPAVNSNFHGFGKIWFQHICGSWLFGLYDQELGKRVALKSTLAKDWWRKEAKSIWIHPIWLKIYQNWLFPQRSLTAYEIMCECFSTIYLGQLKAFHMVGRIVWTNSKSGSENSMRGHQGLLFGM